MSYRANAVTMEARNLIHENETVRMELKAHAKLGRQQKRLPNGKVLVLEASRNGWRYVYVRDKKGRKSDERIFGAGTTPELLNEFIAETLRQHLGGAKL